MDETLNIKDLTKEEFETLVINILYYLDYSIDKTESTKFDYYLEKEVLEFILKINFKENGELVIIEEIINFQDDVIETNSHQGYLITNSDFEPATLEIVDNFKKQVRLFNFSEINRLYDRLLNN
jgi:hypothetical protein